MKVCPKCDAVYTDDQQAYCLADGAVLLKKKSAAKHHSRANEIFAIVLLAFSVLTFLCLVSFDTADPTFNTSSSQPVQNWIGPAGANFAELLFSAIGITAYLLPALLALIAWRVYLSASLMPRVAGVIGFILFIGASSGLVRLIGWHGGLVGALFADNAVHLLGTLGAAVFLLALFAVSSLLISNFSFGWLISHFDVAWGNLKIKYDERRKKMAETRAAEAAARSEQREMQRLAQEKALKDAPTISIADTPRTASRTKAKAAAAVTGPLGEPEPTVFSVPTIGAEKVPDTVVTNDEGIDLLELDATRGHIPITPTKHTGELDGDEAAEPAGDEPEVPVELPKPSQNFEGYVLPGSHLLNPAAPRIEQKEQELLDIAESLAEKTKEFNVAGKVVNICPGPVVTTYEFKPDPGVKYSRVTGLVDDLCLALKAESIRIDRIPGKAFVGIEVPNYKRETIQLRDVIESKKFKDSESLLTLALGKTIDGLNYVADLAKMPHLLIAGATGAGKSVGVNTLVVSILYKARPDEVKFIMVDPKRLELGVYADIPHLATPIITDPKRAAISLRWAVTEMERRYKDLAGYGVRNIDGYNVEARRRNAEEQWDDNGEPHRILPYIVIIIDELADLMMVSGKEVEESITRLAQMARAVGIHLVLATQRPSVDVITGLIKANFPARISFRVSSKVDSRTIIDGNGAEGLLGKGDMLFLPPASSQVIRVHGAYVDEKEIGKIVDHIKAQGRPEYDTTITKTDEEMDDSGDLPGRRDPLFWDALKTVVGAKRGSTSLLQRHLRIGYGRAAAILDAMVKEGYIGDMDGSTRARPILQKAYDDLQDMSEMENNQ